MTNELAQELEPIEQEEQVEEKPVEAEKPEEKPEEKEEAKPEKVVPLGALHEERQRRKELQAEIQRIQQEQAQRNDLLERRFMAMQQYLQQQSAPKIPAYEEDPLAHTKHKLDATEAELAQIREWHRQQAALGQQEAARAQYVHRIQSAVVTAEAEFAQEHDDYLAAVNHLKATRAAQLEALGLPPQDVQATVMNEAYQVAEAALRSGKNPAEVAYAMARASGYVKKEEKPAQEQKIETLRKGVKAASSLGSGGKPTGRPTVDAVAEMSDDEFDEFMKSGGWNKLG